MAAVEQEETSQPEGVAHGRRSHVGGSPAAAPTQGRSGWGASEGKSGGQRSTVVGGGRNRVLEEPGEQEIEEIPDTLEDDEEDLTAKVADAPRNVARKVQSMAELDHNINFAEAAAAAVRSGAYGKTVDLSLLTAQLIPQSKLGEGDVEWTFDALLQECAQAHQADTDRLEAGADQLVLTDAVAATTAAADATFAGDAAGMTTRGGGIQGTMRQRGALAPPTGGAAAGPGAHK